VEEADGSTLVVLQEEKAVGAVKHRVVSEAWEADTNETASGDVEEADVAK
jgi:hypothetical protein